MTSELKVYAFVVWCGLAGVVAICATYTLNADSMRNCARSCAPATMSSYTEKPVEGGTRLVGVCVCRGSPP
jgi:hypothetical protein